ncbi:hypothetical protein [Flexithrix dorotheae]|uniref:hypothetical protein n=1 Tax=Flexithrix dorotheae TaxID=70993 RepID=UPI00038027CC|nr:hypothetical protein [Flexithrix dorotheae]
MRPTISWIILICLSIISLNLASAQSESSNLVSDPLQNPEIWAKIRENPKDMRLWAIYLNKDLNSLDETDEKLIVQWASTLGTTSIENPLSEEIWNEVAENHHYNENQKVILEMEYKAFHENLEGHILDDSKVLKELNSNVEMNFVIIEDILKLEFEELGTKYISYNSVHSNDNYPKTKWIEEKNFELAELKILNMELIKTKLYAID